MREITGSTVQAKVKTNDRLTLPNRQGILFPAIGNRIPSRREPDSRLLGTGFPAVGNILPRKLFLSDLLSIFSLLFATFVARCCRHNRHKEAAERQDGREYAACITGQ